MTRLADHSLINPRSFTPLSMLVGMCAAWLIIFWIAPVEIYIAAQAYPYIVLAGCFIGLGVGLVLFEPRKPPELVIDADARRAFLGTLYRITFILGLIGIALRVFDWAVLRGLTIDAGFIENRERIESAGANAFSMASTLFVPFTLVPYMVHAVARRNGDVIGRSWTSVGLALLWPLLTIVIGSRSSMFMSIGMLAITRIIVARRTSMTLVLGIALGFVGLIYLGGLIFIERLTEIGLNVEGVIRFSAFTNLVPVTSDYYRAATSLSNWGRDTLFIATTFSQYILHGIPEFTFLVEHYNGVDQWGEYGFAFFPRIFAALWGVRYDPNIVVFSIPRIGVYTSMFGPFYADFGPLSPIFCLILGGIISFVRRRVLMGDIAALPLYVTFATQVVSAVVINTFLAAYGIFFNIAFIALWIVVAVSRRSISVPRPARLESASA